MPGERRQYHAGQGRHRGPDGDVAVQQHGAQAATASTATVYAAYNCPDHHQGDQSGQRRGGGGLRQRHTEQLRQGWADLGPRLRLPRPGRVAVRVVWTVPECKEGTECLTRRRPIAAYDRQVTIERHWWNGNSTSRGRRDVYIRTDGQRWEVQARAGGDAGRSKIHQCPGRASAEILANAWRGDRAEWRELVP